MKPVICFTGIDGCGKSTHLRLLGTWLEKTHGRFGIPLRVWDIAENPRFHSHPFISDKSAIHTYLGSLNGAPRALFIFHALLQALHLADERDCSLILADGYWFKYAFTECLHGESLDWLEKMADRFPKPELTVLLDVLPEITWERKPKVTPYECGFRSPNRDNFLDFQNKLRGLFLNKAKRENWHIVEVNRLENEVALDLQNIIFREVLEKWI